MLCARNNRSKNCWNEYKGNLESKVFDHIQPCIVSMLHTFLLGLAFCTWDVLISNR